jgi:hypothetical protein
LLLFSQARHHKYRRQAYLQGNTDYIGTGNLGIESIVIFENDFNAPDTFFLPNNDFTYGVNENLELLLGMNSYYNKTSGWGIQPVDFGLKYNLYDEDNKIPQIDIVGNIQTENIGSKNLSISKTLPMVSLYATKNFSKKFHSVFDAGVQWIDVSPHPSFTLDFYSEYLVFPKQNINFEINQFSTDQRFWNLIFGLGTERIINENFSLEFNGGYYLKSVNQNYYFSFGFNKTFALTRTKKS